VVGCCEHGNETLGFVECGGFFDCIRDYKLVKKDSAS
jgi:hypothetical protein